LILECLSHLEGNAANSSQQLALSAQTIGLIAGLGGFGLILIVVGVVVFAMWRRRQPSVETTIPDPVVVMEKLPIYSSIINTGSNLPLPKRTMPIPGIGSSASKSWVIDYGDITFSEELGRGAYGVVYLAQWRFQSVAVKKIKDSDLSDYERLEFVKESQVLMSLRPHKNVVGFMGIVVHPMCILTEYLSAGSIQDLFLTDFKIDNPTLISFAKDITAGMCHLHSEGVIHRDLATRNLLLDGAMTVKITDFGMSRVLGTGDSGITQSNVGPIKWMSPEALTQQIYNTKSDVFSFAIVLIEILTREEPWPGENPVNVAIAVGRDQLRPPIPDHCPQNLRPIIIQCWAQDPNQRPEFATVHNMLQRKTPPM